MVVFRGQVSGGRMPGHAPVQHNDDDTTAACNQSATAGGQFIIATPRHATLPCAVS